MVIPLYHRLKPSGPGDRRVSNESLAGKTWTCNSVIKSRFLTPAERHNAGLAHTPNI